MVAIRTNSRRAFVLADESLKAFDEQARGPRTQNFAVAIAALLMRGRAGRAALRPMLFAPGHGPGITTGELQHDICDRIFEKDVSFSPNPSERIYKPFTGRFFDAAGNNWRNSFDLQTGLSCDAPFTGEYLRSDLYLGEARTDCSFRDPSNGSCTSPVGLVDKKRTCFNTAKRNENTVNASTGLARPSPKLFTRGYDGRRPIYWVIEPTTDVLMGLLGAPDARVPLFPFMAAVYCGSFSLMKPRPEVDSSAFQEDLGLDDARFYTLFDPNEGSQWNGWFLSRVSPKGSLKLPALPPVKSSPATGALANAGPLPISPFSAQEPSAYRSSAATVSDPVERLRLLEKAAHGHVRALNELAQILSALGHSPEEQRAGLDLLVKTPGWAHLFEVKTWRAENLHAQVRAAVAQLHEYRWRNRGQIGENWTLYLVFDRSPEAELRSWVKSYLIEDRKIIPCWLEDERLRTFEDLQPLLQPLLQT